MFHQKNHCQTFVKKKLDTEQSKGLFLRSAGHESHATGEYIDIRPCPTLLTNRRF